MKRKGAWPAPLLREELVSFGRRGPLPRFARVAQKLLVLALFAAAVCQAQTEPPPLASFTGTVKRMDAGSLTLLRPDEGDLEISCTHKTHYYSGSHKIKRNQIKPGDRVLVETQLDPLLKPEAVNVRLLPAEKP
jgi:hypothetical protein